MLKEPEGYRNKTEGGKANEQRNVDLLNEALGDIELTPAEEQSLIWLSGWEGSTVRHIISAFKKAKENL